MTNQATQKDDVSQLDTIKKTARDLGCDVGEAGWEQKLRKIVGQKLVLENAL